MTYDIRNRLITETINNATNYYTYDLAGNLILVTFANGYQLTMTYDPSHRLTKIEDNLGGKEDFILDATTSEILNDSKYQDGVLIKTLNKVLDNAGNTIKIFKSNSLKSYNYSTLYNDGSISRGQDVNNTNIIRNIYNTGNIQNYSYAGDTISYTYDYDDKIKTITANSQTTTYNYDDFGRLTQLVSPDTGSQIMSYDTINGVKNRVDANNITHKISSDIEGKILTISHTNNNGSLLENFEYYSDNKLKKITDNSGSISFGYNNYGMLNQKTQNINGKDFNIYYENNNIGQLTSMTYPSGMTVHYDYNKGFVSNIYVNGTDIIKNVTYNSIGKEATSWVLGANTVAITKNSDGDVTNFVDNGVLNETLTVDGMSQISSVKDSINANNNISANYNYNYSISNWTNNVGNQSHGTTTNFNISSISGNGSSYSWNYITGTNKTSNYSYDNNGNVITDNKGNYVYDLKNNMISATRNNVTGNYYYNALNQRVIKSVNGQIRYFVYNESNQLIGEYDSTGNVITEYIYFGLRPVAIKTNGNIYMVHTDYLGTPRYILDNASNMLWKWERRDPYGNNVAQGTIEFNLRFAGQYYDVESGLNYNINRMYDANTKRYMQSDPMGLIAGWNTYNYVGRNPLNNVDPLGLKYDKHIVKFFNCDALKLLIERERNFNGKVYDYYNEKFIEEMSSPSPYRVFSFSEDLIQLNTSFDSIIGKVDLDYALRIADSMKASIVQSESLYNAHYHFLKYGWNGLNIIKSGVVNDYRGLLNLGNAIAGNKQIPYENYGTLNMGIKEEGHKNAYKAAYLYNQGLKLKDLFHPAIVNCNNFCGTNIKE